MVRGSGFDTDLTVVCRQTPFVTAGDLLLMDRMAAQFHSA